MGKDFLEMKLNWRWIIQKKINIELLISREIVFVKYSQQFFLKAMHFLHKKSFIIISKILCQWAQWDRTARQQGAMRHSDMTFPSTATYPFSIQICISCFSRSFRFKFLIQENIHSFCLSYSCIVAYNLNWKGTFCITILFCFSFPKFLN